MSKLNPCLWAFLLLWAPWALRAQDPVCQQYFEENGLPSNVIYGIAQDNKGYVWIGTERGLSKFDGLRFRTVIGGVPRGGVNVDLFKDCLIRLGLTPEKDNKPIESPLFDGLRSFLGYFRTDDERGGGLKDNQVFSIQKDYAGRLWFNNFSGQLCYVENDKVNIFSHPSLKQDAKIVDFNLQDSLLHIRVVQGGGVKSYVLLNDKIMFSADQSRYTRSLADGGVLFRQDRKWFTAYGDEILPCNFGTNSLNFGLQECPLSSKELLLSETYSSEIFLVKQGEGKGNVSASKLDLKLNAQIFDLVRYGDTLFVSCSSGLLLYRVGTWQPLGHFYHDRKIHVLVKDSDGNYWAGFRKEGIMMIPSFGFKNVSPFEKPEWYKNYVSSLFSDERGFVMAGTDDGYLIIYDRLGKKEIVKTPFDKKIRRIVKRDEQSYILSGDDGLLLFTLDGRRFERLVWQIDPSSMNPKMSIKGLEYINDDSLYFGTYSISVIVSIQKLASGEWGVLEKPNQTHANRLLRRNISIYRDPNTKRVWIGSLGKLYFFENDGYKEFVSEGVAFDKTIQAFCNSQDGTLWLASELEGVFGVKGDKVVKHYDVGSGLPSNNCISMVSKGHYLWVGTNKGLVSIDLNNDKIEVLNRNDGLINNTIEALIWHNDSLWVGSPTGINVLSLKEFEKYKHVPSINIQNVLVQGKSREMKKGSLLNHDENNISIEFSGLSFRSREEIKYKYRLIGADSSWTIADGFSNIVRYYELPPGNYEFQVYSISYDNLLSVEPATIGFTILKPIWKRLWFILMGIASIVLVLALIFREVLKREALQRQLRESRLSSLKSQMNPHFIFNAMNSIQSYIATRDSANANRYMSKFSRLMRMILSASDKEAIPLSEELDMLRTYIEMEANRFEDNFNFEIFVSPNLKPEEILIPPMLVQPLVENAIKHGLLHLRERPRMLQLELKVLHPNILTCSVKDNGIGREQSALLEKHRMHNSMATSAIKERISLLNRGKSKKLGMSIEDLKDENGNPLGTLAVLEIPFSLAPPSETPAE